ncbi:HAD family hydrolase [Fulvivirga imtechensis]|nr:HAD hydrolase-like protein [Fulvivirga imtechensis]
MKNFTRAKTILWDFDGVLLNSMSVRDRGFELVLKDYPKEKVDNLLDFHRKNGGLSRYVKFRYFIERELGEFATEERVQQMADQFSGIMLDQLKKPELLIDDSLRFVKRNYQRINMHIVSGSDGQELNILCESLGINKYFKSILGSPTPKNELIRHIMSEYKYDPAATVMVGDSINDYEAAKQNNIAFYAYNNNRLKANHDYIESFETLQ